MNKLITLSIALLIGLTSFGQRRGEVTSPTMPKNDKKRITYTAIKEAPGSKMELQKKALKWFNDFYPNAKGVIKLVRDEAGLIQGKAKYRIYEVDKRGEKGKWVGNVRYDINLFLKDGRYKYEITDFTWQKQSRYEIERWEDTEDQYYDEMYAHYLIQTNEYASDLVNKLVKAMEKQPAAKKEEW